MKGTLAKSQRITMVVNCTHKIMFADKQERHFAKSVKEALNRLGIAALTLPLVAFVLVILLFLSAVVAWAVRMAVDAAR
jgi:hypothetical protein